VGGSSAAQTAEGFSLEVSLGPLRLSSPLIGASGCVAFGEEYRRLYENSRQAMEGSSIAQLGAIVTKAVSLKPRGGNPPPRVAETPAGLLNSIGLQNPGLDHFLAELAPRLSQLGTKVIVNLVGDTAQEFAELASILSQKTDFPAFELDLSCPNVEEGGRSFAMSLPSLREVISRVRQVTDRFLIAKLAPNVCDIGEFAQAAVEAGADALTVANTWIGMVVDVERRTSRIGRTTGGVSGPAIRPLTMALVHRVRQAVRVPILASGGAVRTQDVLEYLIVGASAVQIGTGLWIDPMCPLKINRGLREYLARHRMSLGELIGSFQAEVSRGG